MTLPAPPNIPNLKCPVSGVHSKYFHPEYLEIEKIIETNSTRFTTLKDLKIQIGASAFYPPLEQFYGQGELPFIRVSDTDNFIDYTSVLKIPDKILKDYRTLKITEKGDIIVTKGGSIARVGLIDRRSAVCRDLIFFKTSKMDDINYSFIFVYLLTDIYNKMLIRSSSLTAQPHLTLTLVKLLPIFNPSLDFKICIFQIYSKSKSFLDESIKLYLEAEQILLSELGLVNWKPKRQLFFVKNFSDSKTADRIDAEYFQPMYDELIEKVMQYGNGHKAVDESVKIKDRNFTPKDEVSYKYIELANISANGHINGFIEAMGKDLPTRARLKVNTGDVIVSSIEGSLSSIALINGDLDNALCSTGFYVVNSDIFNSETLLVLLKSPLGQLQLKKGCSGTILTAINKEEFKRVLLPRISESIQEQIKQKISEMYKAKSTSKKLLDIAKRSVEIAIEQGEEEAQKWINEQIGTV